MPLFFIGPLIWIVLLILLIAFIASNIVIVPQARAYVIERLGTYRDTWNTGLHFKVPLFERIARKVTLKEQVVDFPPQPVITKDNVTMQIDTVIYFQITDPKMFTYGIESPMAAIENLTDEGGARAPRGYSGRGRQKAVRHSGRRGRKGSGRSGG